MRSQRWLRVKADLLCGTFAPPMEDLFGASKPVPLWRSQEEPKIRLISLATDPETSDHRRRAAGDALETFQKMEALGVTPGPIMSRPIGMLMLVPRDAL